MIWVVSGYKRTKRADLVCEYELDGVQPGEIQPLFGADDGDPVVLQEIITNVQRHFVESLLGTALDLKKLSYWIEAYSEDGKRETVTSAVGEVWYLPPRTLLAFPDAKRVRPR